MWVMICLSQGGLHSSNALFSFMCKDELRRRESGNASCIEIGLKLGQGGLFMIL